MCGIYCKSDTPMKNLRKEKKQGNQQGGGGRPLHVDNLVTRSACQASRCRAGAQIYISTSKRSGSLLSVSIFTRLDRKTPVSWDLWKVETLVSDNTCFEIFDWCDSSEWWWWWWWWWWKLLMLTVVIMKVDDSYQDYNNNDDNDESWWWRLGKLSKTKTGNLW